MSLAGKVAIVTGANRVWDVLWWKDSPLTAPSSSSVRNLDTAQSVLAELRNKNPVPGHNP